MSISISNKKDYSFDKVVSQRTFNAIIGGLVAYGFIVNMFMTMFLSEFIAQIPWLAFLIGYFVVAFLGIFIMRKSNNPLVSFVGYNMLVVPIGCCVALVVPGYALSTIFVTCIVTGICTVVMMVAALIYPDFFLSIGKTLFISLLCAIIVEIIMIICGFDLTILDFVVALIFCGYIGYDWAKINNTCSRTLDAAVDSAAEIYLDIINLFLRLLRILGKSDD